MTSFIPEWGAVSGPELHLRRLFNELGDDVAVRKSLKPQGGQPDYFIEWDRRGWLAICLCRAKYAQVCADQLFESEARTDFLRLLSAADPMLPTLVLMWSCNAGEAALLAQEAHTPGVSLCSREQLTDGGGTWLSSLARPLGGDAAALRRRYFPESEITAVNVGRRYYHRDNSATLTGMFLDREQEWASKLDLTLAPERAELAHDFTVRLLNGVAGSGKTLVALQRAILLAEADPQQQVLILILNTPVVADIRERMHRAGRQFPSNLTMMTFAAWANRQWVKVFRQRLALPRSKREVLSLVRSLRAALPLARLSDQQLAEEIDFVNDAVLDSEAAYLAADRTGRGFALRESERGHVWELYRQVSARLAAAGMRLWSAVASDICLADRHEALEMYQHILVDEAQFLSPAALRLAKLALHPGGTMFLCADPRQGFMRSRLSWKSVGLDVAGRTRKLRRSYRSTAAILRAATRLLAREVEDDPDDFLAPDYAGMEEGVAPIIIAAGTPQDAVERTANEVAKLAGQRDFPLSTILVIHGDSVSEPMLYQRLCRGVSKERVWRLNHDKKLPPGGYEGEHIRLVSLDTATGLEGTFVFLVGVDALLHPRAGADDQDRIVESRARKLYMAMTRSCYRLTLITAGPYDAAAMGSDFEKRD